MIFRTLFVTLNNAVLYGSVLTLKVALFQLFDGQLLRLLSGAF